MSYLSVHTIDKNRLSSLMLEVCNYMLMYPNDIVLTRVGDFYEAYFDNAVEFVKLTGAVLTAKTIGKQEDKLSIPMAGVPYRSLNDYAMQLVSSNKRVVVVDQLEDPKTVKAGTLVKRGITRIITRSTVVEEGYIDESLNNYLCTIYKLDDNYGLCFGDVSTGDIYITSVSNKEQLITELGRYNPTELLMNEEVHLLLYGILEKSLKYDINITVNNTYYTLHDLYFKLQSVFKLEDLESLRYKNIEGLYSLYVFVSYVESTQCKSIYYGKLPVFYNSDNYLILDIDTRRNLELVGSLNNKNSYSLLSVINKTKTPMGSRLLREWIEKPLVSKSEITKRLDSVDELLQKYSVCETIRENLSGIYDISRILGRMELNRSVPRDLVSLRESLKQLPKLKELLGQFENIYFKKLYTEFNSYEDLHYLLDKAILDNPNSDVKEGEVIKPGYNKKLDTAREDVFSSNSVLSNFEELEKEKTGIRNLKVVNVSGICSIEITKSNITKVPSYYIVEKAMKNCTRYRTAELKDLELRLLSALDYSKSLELDLYLEIQSIILNELSGLTQLSDIVSKLDVLSNLAYVANKNNYVKPLINDVGLIDIKNGRHPVIESALPNDKFIGNDTYLDDSLNRFTLITGPNMAGKSTYMRQVALISILSHMGSYVPCDYANISILDKIFTRIGASDDISSGKSTYMVEMTEVCNILKNATFKSLVLLDEVGRGTSTSDGLAIAQSITEYIHDNIKSKTLFATHYHELIILEDYLDGLKNYHMSVSKETSSDDIVFLRKIERGGLSDSFGIDVAKLAGIPNEVISRARIILDSIDSKNLNITITNSSNNDSNQLLNELLQIDISDLTPLSSYKYLSDLLARLKS